MRVGEVKRRLRKSLLQCVKVRTQASEVCLANPKLYVFMIDENVRGRVLNDGRKDPPSLDELPVPIYPGNIQSIQCMLMTCHSKQPEGLLHETDWISYHCQPFGGKVQTHFPNEASFFICMKYIQPRESCNLLNLLIILTFRFSCNIF